MFDNVVNIIGTLGDWSYLVVFVVVMLECQALLGLFMPGESLVLVSGFFARQGVLNLPLLIAVISGAAIFGDTLGYELGRRLGLDWLTRYGSRVRLRHEHLHRMDVFLVRHGGKAVFASHFMHLFRSLMPYIAGARRMQYTHFLIFNAMGCVAWATIFVLLGNYAGASWQVVAHWVGHTTRIALGVLLLISVAVMVWHRFRGHR